MTDRELTRLQESGYCSLQFPVQLGELLAGLDTLGIQPSAVELRPWYGTLEVIVK